ncbi:hypothetical protein [Streptomyces sp. NPDC059816]|uniref:hypothetical protein n=1 Tax=Streptomyces sp. NPDC059816 TaxID=3346960 RepID=UPI00364B77A8
MPHRRTERKKIDEFTGGTAVVRDWTFVLYPEGRPTERESDAFDHAPELAGGAIGWEEDPRGVRFPCTVRAASARDAVLWAVDRLAAAGVPVSTVKMPLTTVFS